MKKTGYTIIAVLAALLVAGSVAPLAAGEEAEVKIDLADCPQAVQQTIAAESAGGTVLGIEKEVEKGATLYECTIRRADASVVEIEIAANGRVLETEKQDDDDEDEDEDDEDDDEDDDDEDDDEDEDDEEDDD